MIFQILNNDEGSSLEIEKTLNRMKNIIKLYESYKRLMSINESIEDLCNNVLKKINNQKLLDNNNQHLCNVRKYKCMMH